MTSRIEYINAAMAKADYERMEDGQFFATIPGFDGLWAVGRTRNEAAKELNETLYGWLDVHNKIGKHHLPSVDLRDLPAKASEQWDREHVPDTLSPDMIPPWRPLDNWSRRILERVAERPQSFHTLFAHDN